MTGSYQSEVVRMTDQPFDADRFTNGAEPEPAELVEVLPGLLGEIRAVDPASVSKRIGERMSQASSLDELFDSVKGKTSDGMDGKAVRVRSVEWQPYESDRGTIPLAVVQYTDLATNREDEFVTTGTSLVNFLYQAGRLNAIPFDARIVGKKTRGNQTVLNFERI